MRQSGKRLRQLTVLFFFCCIPLRSSPVSGQVVRSARIGAFGFGVGDKPTGVITAKPGMVEIDAGSLITGQFSPDAVRLFVDSLKALMQQPVRDRKGERAEIEGPELHALFGRAVEIGSRRTRENKQDIYSLIVIGGDDHVVGVYRAQKFTDILAMFTRAAAKADAMRSDP